MKTHRIVSLLAVGVSAAFFQIAPANAQDAFRPDGRADPEYSVPDELSLRYAIRFALDNNFTIRQARERIAQASGQSLRAWSSALPTVSAGAEYSQVSERLTEGFTDDRSWGVGLTARQTLFAGGAVVSGIRAARDRRTAAELELEAITNQVLFAVRTKFNAVLLAKATIRVREESLRLLEEELKTARNRYDAGAGAQFDVLRAEVALANGRPPLIRARNDYRIAIEELREVLGFTTRTKANVTKIPEFAGELTHEVASFNLEDALSAARANRAELTALAKTLRAAEAGVTAARSGYLPQVAAFAGWQSRKPSTSGVVSLREEIDGWQYGVQGNWAIFDGRRTQGDVRSAKALAEQARLALLEKELAVDVEVRRAFASWQESEELVASSTKVVEQAQEAVRLARARFDVGAATQLDVLQAQVAFTEAGNNKVQSLYAHSVALAQLRTSMGLKDPVLAQP